MSIKTISKYGLSIIAVSLLSACGSSDNKLSSNNIVESEDITKTPIDDGQTPSFSLNGSNPQLVSLGSSFVNQGAYSYDSFDGNLTPSITTNNNVNTTVAGCYQQTYLVSDSSSNSRSISRTILVGTSAQRHSPNSALVTEEIAVTTNNNSSSIFNLLDYATDANCDDLKVSNVSQADVDSVNLSSNGMVTYNPLGNVGSHFFSYTVSDSYGGSSTSGVTIGRLHR